MVAIKAMARTNSQMAVLQPKDKGRVSDNKNMKQGATVMPVQLQPGYREPP
ncbi:MAG: hypothetical protein JRI87_12095, partial [Deltaproteobacteria bacterium]|nr:hypothetical protein [Deltaproteobacteria bacterium]